MLLHLAKDSFGTAGLKFNSELSFLGEVLLTSRPFYDKDLFQFAKNQIWDGFFESCQMAENSVSRDVFCSKNELLSRIDSCGFFDDGLKGFFS